MKYLTATLTAAVLALAIGGTALAGGRPVQHTQPRDIDHDRHERHDRDCYPYHSEPCYQYPCYEYPCYEYPCYEYPCYEYPCYDYPPCYPYRDYKPYKGDRRTDGAPVHIKVK